MLRELNSPVLYLICGAIILFVAIVCVIALVRAWRAGIKIGMDKRKLKRAVTASITFSILPSAGILLGVIALSGSLGIPWPWLRLSVIGALHYETQVAEAASEAVGIGALSAANMTPRAFATIALLMSICIMWGMVLSIFFNKGYLAKIQRKGSGKKKDSGFGDLAMTAMFIGLVSLYRQLHWKICFGEGNTDVLRECDTASCQPGFCGSHGRFYLVDREEADGMAGELFHCGEYADRYAGCNPDVRRGQKWCRKKRK